MNIGANFTEISPLSRDIASGEVRANGRSTVNRRTRVVRGLGRPTGWVGLGCVGWVGRGSEKFPKILKFGRPLVTAEVIPDNLIIINTDE